MIRSVSRFAEKRGDYVVLDNAAAAPGDHGIKDRIGNPRRLNLDVADVKTVLGVKARRNAHNNILEGEA